MFRVFLKRQLVSPLRLVLLILMILSALIVNRLTLPRQETRTVLLYQETGSEESEENGDKSRTADRQADSSGSLTVNDGDSLSGNCLIDSLEEGSGMFVFRTAGSRGELEREVRRGGAECGFILPADYAERLAEGNLAGLITYVSSSYTRRGETAKETVFAAFIRQYAPEILKDAAPELYETGDQPDDDEALDTLIRQKFDALREGGTIFHTEFRTMRLPERLMMRLPMGLSGRAQGRKRRWNRNPPRTGRPEKFSRRRFCFFFPPTFCLPAPGGGEADFYRWNMRCRTGCVRGPIFCIFLPHRDCPRRQDLSSWQFCRRQRERPRPERA